MTDSLEVIIPYVCHLHHRPRAFTGDDLVLYLPGAAPVRIRPAHNAFIAFPPETGHEAGPVRCDPDDRGAGRFSIGGFVPEPESPAEGWAKSPAGRGGRRGSCAPGGGAALKARL